MKKPRILLIGAGAFGKVHLRILKKLDKEGRIDFKGFVVRQSLEYKDLAKSFAVPVYEQLTDDILKKVDAVVIVTPPESHFDIVSRCLKYCDVFVEKPLVTTNVDAIRLQRSAKKYKHSLIVGHIFRYDSITIKLGSLLKNSELPKKISGSFINSADTDRGRHPSLELLHMFDIVDYIWEKIPRVVYSNIDGRVLSVNIRYNKNCDATFDLGWRGGKKERNIRFVYSNKTIEADYSERTLIIKKNNGSIIKKYKIPNKKEPLYVELLNFSRQINLKKPLSNIKMASRVLSIAIRAIPRKIEKPRVAIIGGGIFGLSVAGELGNYCEVTLFEKNKELMQEGTLINQFRHHYGYHYPRSDETVVDVQNSRADFEEIFKKALFESSPTYYALAKEKSKVNVENFIKFCNKHKLPYKKEYPPDDFLSKNEINLSIRVPEPSYHHEILKGIVESRISSIPNIKINLNTIVTNCVLESNGCKIIEYNKNGKIHRQQFDYIINATYANINRFVSWLNFEKCQIRVDLAEVLIVKIPTDPISVTVIDGEFATLMPTGNPNEFTLYHVRESIIDRYVPSDGLVKKVKEHKTNREAILRESLKFFPILKNAKVIESRIVHRGVQAYHEHDDSRVADLINHGFGCWSILSGKILSSVTMAKKISKIIKGK